VAQTDIIDCFVFIFVVQHGRQSTNQSQHFLPFVFFL
jgi:hypothetical protein